MDSGAGVVAESRISPARAGWTGLLTGRADQADFADGPRISTPKAPGRWTEARRATGKCSPALQDRSASDGSPDAALRHCRQSNHGRGTDMSHTGGPDPDGRGRRGMISRRGASRSVRCTDPGTKRSRSAALVRHAAAGLLMGWVGFAALLALPLQARADVLISNIGQTLSSSTQLAANEMAQGFETGDNTGNYTLESIDINFLTVPSSSDVSSLTVTLWSASILDKPDSSVATLSHPSNLSTSAGGNIKTFTAPANTVLDAETMYFVHMSYTGGSAVHIDRTQATGEDANPASGWSINDNRLFRTIGTSNSWNTSIYIGSIRVKGTVDGGTPTLSTDATLSDLDLFDNNGNTITLSPTFMPGTTSYTMLVDNSVDEITIFPENNDANATYEIQDGSGTALVDADSGEDDFQVTLSVGENTIKVEVTAEDTTTQTYTVVVTRRMSTTTPPAPAEVEVLNGWSLKPTGLGAGDKFRLLFLSSTNTNATSFDIADYNAFIQGRAAAGHTDIRTYSTGFRAVGCTADSDATANTGTTGTGEVIYWLGGNKAADNYGDFYDGSWAEEVNDKDESGNDGPNTFQQGNYPFTGCADNGTESLLGTTSYALGTAGGSVRVGRPNSSTSGDGPISGSNSLTGVTSNRPMYGLSPVFEVAANAAPTFTDGTSTTREFLNESIGDATADAVTRTNIGQPVTATDTDMGDTLEYGLEGTDAAKFTIDTTTGQIRDKGGENYDYETKASYSVTVTVMDDNGGSDTIAVTLNVMDQDEAPLKPGVPSVVPVVASTTTLDVNWTDRDNTGRPNIDTYDLQYREGTSGNWTNGPQNVTGTSSAIGSLMANTLYQVQIRATNAEGDSAWSESGSGTTGAPVLPTVSISAVKTTAVFKEDAIVYTLTRSGSTTAALPVTVMLTQTKDFLARAELSKTVTIAVGQSTKTFTVAASSFEHFATGTLVEAGTLTATVQDGADYDLGTPSSVNVAIVIGMTVRFDMASYSVGEAAGTLPFMLIARTGPGAPRPTADYDLGEYYTDATNGTALLNVDFNESGSPLSFPVGDFSASGGVWQAEQAFIITINEDALDEDDETFDILLERRFSNTSISVVDASGNSCGSVCTVTATITDDDTAGVTVSETALTVTEDDMTGDSYTVVLDSQPTANVTITVGGYTGSDVTPNPASLTFAPADWNTAKTVTVTAVGDADTTDDTVTLTHTATSTDPKYDAAAASVTVTVEETSAATGQPAITGAAQIGKTLTAEIGTIADADGLPGTFPDDYTLQWRRVDADGTSNETDISGETSGTYMPVAADVGKKIKVQVSFTDGGSNAEGPLTSAAYPSNAPVAAAAGACPAVNDWCTTLTVGLEDQTHQQLYGFFDTFGALVDTTIDDGDGTTWTVSQMNIQDTSLEDLLNINLDKFLPRGSVFDLGGTMFTTDTDSEQPGAGRYAWLLPAGFAWVDGQDVTVSVKLPANAPATGVPEISGKPQVGATLSAGTTGIMDFDGLTSVSYTYQWIRVDVDGTSNPVNVGTDDEEYTLVPADEGKRIKVQVTFTDDDSNAEELTSEAYLTLSHQSYPDRGIMPARAACPAGNDWCATMTVVSQFVVGTAVKDFGFSASPAYGALDDTSFDYDGSTFTVEAVGIRDPDNGSGYHVRLVLDAFVPRGTVFDLNGYGFTTDATSEQSSAGHYRWDFPAGFRIAENVEYRVSLQVTDNTPAEGKPTISGPAQVGRTLTAATADITDDEGLTSVSYTYQWIAAGTNIAGAMSSTYTPTSSEQGDKITVRVTFDDDEDNPETLTSDETAPVVPDVASCLGTAVWCSTLTVEHGTPDMDGEFQVGLATNLGTPPESFGSLVGATFTHLDTSYTVTQIFADFSNLYFATSPNLPDGGAGLTLHVQRVSGALELKLSDRDTYVLSAGLPTGTKAWEFMFVLSTGPANPPLLRSFDPFNGDYRQDTDEGTLLAVSLFHENRDATGTPTISGTAQVGGTLEAGIGTIADADGLPGAFPDDYTFQWVRVDADGVSNETNIGADAVTYTPVAADVGKKIKVEVSFTDDGGTSETLTSDAYPSSGTIINIDGSNTAPVFTGGTTQSRTLAETVGDATVTTVSDIGTAVEATDADAGDTLTYSLGGTDAGMFDFDDSNGQIKTKVGERYDYEAKQSYAVTVVVTDGAVSVSAAVTINITNNANEPPPAPAAPTVTPTSGSTTSLDVSWTAPANTGRPTITGYDLQYRVDGESSWTDGPQGVSGTSASIVGLVAGTSYEVQVRAVNTDGAGAWSGASDGDTTLPTPTVRFGASAYTAIEGLAGTVVTMLLDPAATRVVTILVTTTPQDGASSADYDGVPQSVTFAAGETEQSFTVTATDDTVDDDGESLQLGFDALPSGVLLGSPATATVALVEDVDVSTWFLFFEESSYTATEGGTAARVTVGLSNPWKPELNESLTIGIFTPEHRGGADASDYSGVPERVTFQPGQTRVSFTVTATNDSDDDDGESIYLQFAGFDIEDLELGRAPRATTVHLRDNDGASAVQAFFGAQTYRVNEGSAVDVSVHLDKAPGRELTLLITTAHGNGASSADYSGVPESITFSGSQSTRTFAVQALNDNVNDDQEYLTFGFGALPASVSAGDPATTTLNLVDTNDSISIRTISFDGQDTNVRELLEGSIYSLYVYLNSAADNDIVVPLQVTHLDGATPADYSGLPETVIIPAGERRENVIIRVLEDTEDDHGEGIRVGFGSLPRGVRKDNQADTATFRFLDNDTLPAISIAGADVKEWPNPQSYLKFVASLDYAPEFEVAVDYRTVNGTAVAGQDYESASGTLTFAEGERSKYIRVRVCHDGIDESTETMTLQLSNPVRTKLEGNGSATGSIRNNNGSGAKPCATGISVSDVSYPEPNINHLRRQEMEFEVSLNQADTGTVTVDYQTVNGTATAGQDYESASGTVTFRPGQTRRTVKVVVVADAHDDPGETFTLRLSNPSGAYIGDGEGTATLTNSGLMPGAWLSRFGRVASDHAVQAIEARIYDTSGHARENHLTIGGQRVDWQMLGRFAPSGPGQRGDRASPDGVAPRFDPWLGDQAARTRMDRLGAEAMAVRSPAVGSLSVGGMADLDSGGSPAIDSLSGEGMGGVDSGHVRGSGGGDAKGTFRRAVMELLGLEDFSRLSEAGVGLMGSSFFYSRPGGAEAPGWLGPWSLWGETAVTRFDGAEGPLSLNGDVTTATVGFDTRRERWMAGLALAYSEGQGAYTHRIATGGALDSSLTSLIPYASYSLNERTSVWGTLGYGVGDLTLTPEGAASGIETGLSTSLAAFGGRGVFSVRTAGAAQFEFAVRADARLTSTVSDAVENLAGAAGATSRVRAVLEGRGSVPLAWGGDLSPRLEVGLRYDGGDAETGAGLEIGGGLGYAAGRLSVEVTARGLVAHQDTEYEEWGFSGSIAYTPSEDGRGFSMRLGSAWGATQSGVQSLWNQQDASGLARNAAFEAAQRFEAELGYGIAGRRRNSLWVPFIAAQAADGGGQALQMGVRLASESSLEAELKLGRRQDLQGVPEHAVELRASMRW